MSRLPDFEAWAVFAKVAETGSFVRAAEELGLSKPTVSKAVGRLEDRLGATLFHRTSRRLSLTESGRTSLERAARILNEGEMVEAEAAAQSTAPRGLVRLAAPMSFGIEHLGPALPDFFAAYPEVSLDINLSDEKVDLVTEGYDLALRIGALTDSSLLARRLCGVSMLLVGAPSYFAKFGRPEHPRDLIGHRLAGYAYGPAHEGLRFHHATEGDYSIALPHPIRTNNSEVLQPSLLSGLALAMQPEFLIWRELDRGLLESVLEDWIPQRAALHIVTPPSSLRPARVQVLIDFLASKFAHAPWERQTGCKDARADMDAAVRGETSSAALERLSKRG
jgi:DNA-binding transcriptional LysR family regulator